MLRPVRYYEPYSVSLLEFKHDLYAGTDIPKNFSSKVHLDDPSTGTAQDNLIYMNNPLRYRGETLFQAGWIPGDRGDDFASRAESRVLDALRRLRIGRTGAADAIPDAICSAFTRKRRNQGGKPAPARKPSGAPLKLEPALANACKRNR